jgi:hypothetical protein
VRTTSASQIKRPGLNNQKYPKEGTKLRGLYDLFQANKGRVISYKITNGAQIEFLKDFYGLDIRCIRKGAWVLAGEWFNDSDYVDYIAEAQNNR